MTDRETMQMALEALEASIDVPCYGGHPKQEAAAAALRAQLEQPEQVSHAHEWFRTGAMEPGKMRCIHCGAWRNDASLTTSPQQQAEPVALIRDGVLRWHIPHEHYARPAWTAHGTHMLYTTPLQRQPLTDEQIAQCLEATDAKWSDAGAPPGGYARLLISAIEAAHGIKT